MWLVVGLFFYGLHLMLRSSAKTTAVSHAVAEMPGDTATPASVNGSAQHDDTPTDHQISAPV